MERSACVAALDSVCWSVFSPDWGGQTILCGLIGSCFDSDGLDFVRGIQKRVERHSLGRKVLSFARRCFMAGDKYGKIVDGTLALAELVTESRKISPYKLRLVVPSRLCTEIRKSRVCTQAALVAVIMKFGHSRRRNVNKPKPSQ